MKIVQYILAGFVILCIVVIIKSAIDFIISIIKHKK